VRNPNLGYLTRIGAAGLRSSMRGTCSSTSPVEMSRPEVRQRPQPSRRSARTGVASSTTPFASSHARNCCSRSSLALSPILADATGAAAPRQGIKGINGRAHVHPLITPTCNACVLDSASQMATAEMADDMADVLFLPAEGEGAGGLCPRPSAQDNGRQKNGAAAPPPSSGTPLRVLEVSQGYDTKLCWRYHKATTQSYVGMLVRSFAWSLQPASQQASKRTSAAGCRLLTDAVRQAPDGGHPSPVCLKQFRWIRLSLPGVFHFICIVLIE
jgi:hypothetical protein